MLRHVYTVLMLCFLAAAIVSEGYSQNETPEGLDSTKTYQIDEVVTTGTRTYRKIIDVPYSIERIDNTQFKYEKKTSVDNVLGMIPGLFFQNRYGNHDVRVSIRGFGSRSNSGIRGVRILLDHIPESEPDGQTRIEAIDFQSIGTIEVVKGNSSSLYTNAPGGVINFINDIGFQHSHATQFNEFGSFGLRSNGFKTGIRTEKYGFLMTYNYHTANGYRPHSEDYWHILNSVLELNPGDDTRLSIYTYFVDGLIKLPGSLTKQQFEADPFQSNRRDVGRDAKRVTTKGRLGIRFNTQFGRENSQEIDITGYATMKYFERTADTYRIINRNGLGATGRYVNRHEVFGLRNEVSIGTDLFYQTGPVEEYANIGGMKGEPLSGLTNDVIANLGGYIQNALTLVDGTLDLLLTGRYDKVVFDIQDQNLGVRSDNKRFEDFTPKVALNYKLTPTVAAYTSYGLSFDSPAANELDNYPTSSRPNKSLNPDLRPQQSKSFEIGIKGNLISPDADFLRVIHFEGTFFDMTIKDEVVPFEVFGDVFFRNSARTHRAGIELGTTMDIVQGLVFKGAYTFSDFSYKNYIARSIDVDSTGEVVSDKDFGGNMVPSIPRHNFSLSLSCEGSLSEAITGFIKGNYTNVSGMYTDDSNSEKTTGYQLVGASLGCDIAMGRLNVLLNVGVNNLLDKTYVAFVNINSARKEFYEPGEPRNFHASVNFGVVL